MPSLLKPQRQHTTQHPGSPVRLDARVVLSGIALYLGVAARCSATSLTLLVPAELLFIPVPNNSSGVGAVLTWQGTGFGRFKPDGCLTGLDLPLEICGQVPCKTRVRSF